MSDGATTMKSKLVIGLKEWLGAAAIVILGGASLGGTLNFNEVVSTVKDGVSYEEIVMTGATISINNRLHYFTDVIPLTMTGGNTGKGDMVSLRASDYFTGSGFITSIGVSWIYAPAGGTSDIWFATGTKTATGNIALQSNGGVAFGPQSWSKLDNISNSTGSSILLTGTGALRWNGAYRLKMGSLTDPTSSGSGYLIISGYEDPAE